MIYNPTPRIRYVIGLGAATLASGLISGIGNLFNLKSQSDTNKQNLEEAQRNRDFQAAMQKDAQDFNLDMWNRNNEYNDPSAVIDRLTRAGINPALALSGGMTQPATAASSAAAAGGAQGNAQAPRVDFSQLAAAFPEYQKMKLEQQRVSNESKVADAQEDNLEADSEAKRASAGLSAQQSEESKARINKLNAETLKIGNETMTREQFESSLDDQHRAIEQDIALKADQMHFIKEQTQGQMNLNATFYRRLNAELRQMAAETDLTKGMTETQKQQAEQISRHIALYLSEGDAENPSMFDLVKVAQEKANEMYGKNLEWFDANQYTKMVESGSRSFNNVIGSIVDVASFFSPVGAAAKAAKGFGSGRSAQNTLNSKNFYGDSSDSWHY